MLEASDKSGWSETVVLIQSKSGDRGEIALCTDVGSGCRMCI